MTWIDGLAPWWFIGGLSALCVVVRLVERRIA